MALATEVAVVLRRRGHEAEPPAPPVPANYEIALPDSDTDEETVVEAPRSGFLGTAMAIDYRDSRGRESHRRITLHRIEDRGGDLHLRAYCHERRAARLFKAGSVRRAIDLATGEIVEDAAELDGLFRNLAQDETTRLYEPTAAVLRRRRPGVAILLFLARCDGFEHPSETRVVLDYLDADCAPPGLSIPQARHELARLHPDRELFYGAVDQLAAFEPEELVRVARFATRLIEADGTVTDTEASFAATLADTLDLVGP